MKRKRKEREPQQKAHLKDSTLYVLKLKFTQRYKINKENMQFLSFAFTPF